MTVSPPGKVVVWLVTRVRCLARIMHRLLSATSALSSAASSSLWNLRTRSLAMTDSSCSSLLLALLRFTLMVVRSFRRAEASSYCISTARRPRVACGRRKTETHQNTPQDTEVFPTHHHLPPTPPAVLTDSPSTTHFPTVLTASRSTTHSLPSPRGTYSIKGATGLLVLSSKSLDATLSHAILVQGGLQLPLKLVIVGLELL
ncbi:hypothetical protein E2C01_030034 [Portunus trituberculatus]|uniref:Uncharacterized protein n=1 Tax=Portunus trituberculatus TaxID=210409 RepID=A0A5B7ER02_PORTR|nr:hypothetical protein [Portunus trituberculatus]